MMGRESLPRASLLLSRANRLLLYIDIQYCRTGGVMLEHAHRGQKFDPPTDALTINTLLPDDSPTVRLHRKDEAFRKEPGTVSFIRVLLQRGPNHHNLVRRRAGIWTKIPLRVTIALYRLPTI